MTGFDALARSSHLLELKYLLSLPFHNTPVTVHGSMISL